MEELPVLTDDEPLSEQTIELYLNYLSGLKSKILILPRSGDISPITKYVTPSQISEKDLHQCVIGVDWDQTITQIHNKELGNKATKAIRGDTPTKDTLNNLFERGAELIVITAQQPNSVVVNNLRTEVIKLDLQDIFRVPKIEKKKIFEHLQSWGSNQDISIKQLTQRLAILWILNSPRFAADLARIGDPSRIRLQDDDKKAQYQLIINDPTNPQYGEFGGRQILQRTEISPEEKPSNLTSEDFTCPLKNLREYILRTKDRRVVEVLGDGSEVHKSKFLFLKLEPTGDTYESMTSTDLIQLVQETLKDVVHKDQIHLMVEDPAKIIQGEGGQGDFHKANSESDDCSVSDG